MRARGFIVAAWGLALAGVLFAAAAPQAECGASATRAQQEAFLHLRSNLQGAKARMQTTAAIAPRAARFQQDFGNVAVMDASDGVVTQRNFFNLDNRTLVFTPGPAGYTVALGEDTFDAAAALAGPRLPLEDDDTERAVLPFAFPFYGAAYTQAWVNSNGSVTFTRGETGFTGFFALFSGGPPAIAGMFTDIDPALSASGVHVAAESGRWVATWNQIPPAGASSGGIHTFQIRLYPDGRIEVAYRTASPDEGVAGITPGAPRPVTLVDFASSPAGPFPDGVAELFSDQTYVDVITAARRFYETHDDSYDYLVFYNSMGVPSGAGIVAYELTLRSSGEGYGDTSVDMGATFGSPRRLQAVLNIGPTSQYPLDPRAFVPSRGVVGDTPLSILGHETGHLWLALVSVPHPTSSTALPPMLGAQLAHWAFPFHTDASFLEGNRIADGGPQANPRFRSTATVERYSQLDQYLMGFRDPREVEPFFAVLNSGSSNSRPPQAGIQFNGTRFDISVDDVIRAAGRRTPDSTVAQRHFRMAFILIVPEGSTISEGSPEAAALAQVERYRAEFGPFFERATDFRATLDTSLRRGVSLSLAPYGGVPLGAAGTASIEIQPPAEAPLTFALSAPQAVLQAPSSVTIPAGQTRVSFPVSGLRVGVEELRVTPSDPAYAEARARVPVNQTSNLRIAIVSGDKQVVSGGALENPIVVTAVDLNKVPYSGVTVRAAVTAGGRVEPESAVTDAFGRAVFRWTPAPGSVNALTVAVDGAPSSAATAVALGPPQIVSAVQAASFVPRLAPGSFGTLFGGSLTAGRSASFSAPFPDASGGVRVRINGITAQLVYLSDFQLNFLTPASLTPGPAQVVVETAVGASPPFQVQVDAAVPGIFFDAASGYGAILIAGTSSVTQVRPARAGEFIEVYCTGLGTEPAVTANIAGMPVTVTFAGATAIPGLQQVNIQIPPGLPSGAQNLALAVNGMASNTVKVQIAAP
jgi:uncharacterized protein (TIGR03437 family)